MREIIDCKSLENVTKNVYDGVCFNKIARLCCTNCNSTIARMKLLSNTEVKQKRCLLKKRLYSNYIHIYCV